MVVRTGKNPIFLRAIGRMFAPETEHLEDRFRKRRRHCQRCDFTDWPRQRRGFILPYKSGSCNYCFGACSAFTHVAACTLAGSLNDPLHRMLRQVCYLRRRFDCLYEKVIKVKGDVAPAALVAATFFGSSFSFSFPTSSASTSFVSHRIGPRDFTHFVVGSLFFRELLSFLKGRSP